MKELKNAVRQYQHNDGSGLVMGYDEAETNLVVSNLLRELDELAAQVERLRGAWESVKATDWDEPIEEVLAETPAQSLEAVKREAQLSALDRFYNHLQGMALSNCWDTESDAYHVSEELKDWCRDFVIKS